MDLQTLKQQIQQIEWQERSTQQVFPFGVSQIDDALPQKGILAGSFHEVAGTHEGSVLGFCSAMLGQIAQQRGPILWCAPKIDIYTPGLSAFGLFPKNIYFTQASPKETLWILEEALRTQKLGAVVAQLTMPLKAQEARRLQLAASQSGVTAFLLFSKPWQASSSIVAARWLIQPYPSELFGSLRFLVELTYCKGGLSPITWVIEWHAKALSFHLVRTARESHGIDRAVGAMV